MIQIRTVVRAAGLAILLALPQMAQAGVYFTVEARYSDDRETWQSEGSYILVANEKPTALELAKKRLREVYGETNVLEVRIMRGSDAVGSKPEVVWSSSGGKAAEAPKLPERGPEADAPPPGKKQIIVKVYKSQDGKSVEQKDLEFRTNSDEKAAREYYEKMKLTDGYTATWNAPGWDKPEITFPEKKWVDLKDTYSPPKETIKDDPKSTDKQPSKLSDEKKLIGRWKQEVKEGVATGGSILIYEFQEGGNCKYSYTGVSRFSKTEEVKKEMTWSVEGGQIILDGKREYAQKFEIKLVGEDMQLTLISPHLTTILIRDK